MNKTGKFKQIFNLYMSDLSYDEIERLIKREASEVYEFFKSEIPKPDKRRNRIIRAIILFKSLFKSFLTKLTPARRFFYFASLLFLIFGFMNEMSGYILLSFVIVNLLLAFELADKLLVKNELEVAEKIQAELVPKQPPVLANYDLAFHYESAKEVGGDYLDLIKLPDSEKTILVLGDVSGKGIAAALYVVRVQAIIHQLVEKFVSLREMVIDLKKYFSHNLRREFFLTLVTAEVKEDNSINICRAGHNPVYYFNCAKKEFTIIQPAGLAIGFNDKAAFEKILEEITIKPEKDDIVFFYTDGVTETMNNLHMLFGENKVKEIILNNCAKSPEEIKYLLLNNLAFFRGTTPIYDDLAFIILKCKN